MRRLELSGLTLKRSLELVPLCWLLLLLLEAFDGDDETVTWSLVTEFDEQVTLEVLASDGDTGDGENEVISVSTDEINSSSRSPTSSHDILTLVIVVVFAVFAVVDAVIVVAFVADTPQGDVDDGIIIASFTLTPCDLRNLDVSLLEW